MVECQLPKLRTRVRFPFLALTFFDFRRKVFARDIDGILDFRDRKVMVDMKKIDRLREFVRLGVICLFLVMFFGGCATLPVESDFMTTEFPEPERTGIYHKVNKGETIWRIAKAYDVSINDIVRTNNIPNVAQIERNQLVFIPGAYAVKEIVLEQDQHKDEFVWPVDGKVTRYFQQMVDGRMSKGIDIETKRGQIVKASRTGRVVFADYLSGYGSMIILDHQDGFCSVYAQNSELLVQLGDLVQKNVAISRLDGNGHLARLHFQIRRDSIEHNPLYYLP